MNDAVTTTKLEPKTLAGKQIQLVPLSLSHFEPLCEVGLDPSLWRLTTNEVLTPEQMLEYIKTALDDQTSGTSLPFVMVQKSSGIIVGSSRFHSHNRMHRRVVIGHTWIGRSWQRTAVNTEAKFLMLKHAFEELECMRVEFIVNSINEPSRRALLRIGATQEGILRHYVVGKDLAPCDVALFSVTQNDWPRVSAELQHKLSGKSNPPNLGSLESYDKVASDYAEEFGEELSRKPFDRKMLDWLIEKVGDLGPICDMGCGPGQIARYLHERGSTAFGIDFSNEMVKQAQLMSPQLRFEQGNMLALSNVSDNSLGGIAAFYSVVNLRRDTVVQALSEFKRVLRPGGTLLLTHHIGTEVVHRDEWFGKDVSIDFLFFEKDEMKDYVKQAGLLLEEVIERGPYPDFEYPSQRAYTFARKP